MSKTRMPRPAIRLNPAPVPTILAAAGGILTLIWAWLASRHEGWLALIFVIPALHVMALPIEAIVRGRGDLLRIGFQRHELRRLQKVAVYHRRLLGYPHAVACLVCADRTVEISGAFMSTQGFTSLVSWLAPRPEILEGLWPARRIGAERPDLAPRRPSRAG